MMPIKLKALATGLAAAAIESSPAQAVPNEGGGAAPSTAPPV